MKKMLFIVSAFCLYACQSEAERESITSQEQAIANYVARYDNIDTVRLVVNSNAYRLVFKEGVAPATDAGDMVEFNYVGYIFSSGKGVAFDSNMDTLGFTPQYDNGRGRISRGEFISGLDKGLTGMKSGEKAQILFSAAEGFGNVPVGNVPALSALLFEVEIKKITK